MTNSTVEVVKKCCCGNFKELASQAVADIKNRAGKDGMFLNWIEKLPNIQLANFDKMEEMVNSWAEELQFKFNDKAISNVKIVK